MKLSNFKFSAEAALLFGLFTIFSGLAFWVVETVPNRTPVVGTPLLQEKAKEICRPMILGSMTGSKNSAEETSVDTSQFIWSFQSSADEITASAKVDSHNIFGTLLVSSWDCRMKFSSDQLRFVSLVEN